MQITIIAYLEMSLLLIPLANPKANVFAAGHFGQIQVRDLSLMNFLTIYKQLDEVCADGEC